jgi:tetratricopeptide (TPR) repeat protein
MTALARLTHQVLQDPRKYSTWALVVLVAVLVLILVRNLSSGGRSQNSEAWAKLESAKKAEQRVDVAKEYPTSPVSNWALLQAATEYYTDALNDLPNNRDVAVPLFKKALDLFDRVAREAPKDSFQQRSAALGKARTLEARNELAKAIEQYDLVAKTWPDAPEAEHARQLAEALRKPEAAAFYKDLYAYSPTKVTLPPFGKDERTLPSAAIGSTKSETFPPAIPTPLVNMPLEMAPPTAAERSKLELPKAKPDAKPSQPAAKNDSTKTSTTKPQLPADVLAPASGAPKDKAPR